MEKKKDPNLLRSLQYFEAVARHGSLKAAAADLGVTQSAVSHQIKRFSEAIGQQLVTKSGRGIALTETGLKLSKRLTPAFAGLEALVAELGGNGGQSLKLAVCSAFGPGWLIERLADFYSMYPDIDLELRLYAENPMQTGEVADAYIVADSIKPGYQTFPLKEEFLIAVVAPFAGSAGARQAKHRLITRETESGRIGEDWINFCKKAGLKLAELQDGTFLRCSHYMLALQMAKNGHGVALVPDFLAASDIRLGTLVPFKDLLLPSKRTYRLCIKESRTAEPDLKKLADWFRDKASADPVPRKGPGTPNPSKRQTKSKTHP